MNKDTATSYKVGSMGNIKDLLMQTKNSDSEPMAWRRSGNDSKEDDNQGKFFVFHKGENEEDEKETATKEKEISEPQPAVPSSPNSEPDKKAQVKKQKTETKPSSKPIQEKSQRSQPVRQHRKGSFKEIEENIKSFSLKEENCQRHMIFLPTELSSILYYAYGERRLSAVISVIVREHIDNFKNDIRQKIAEKSNLLMEQD